MPTFLATDPDTQQQFRIEAESADDAAQAFKQHLSSGQPQHQPGDQFAYGGVPGLNKESTAEVANQFKSGIATAADAFANRSPASERGSSFFDFNPLEGPLRTLRGLGGIAQAAAAPVMGGPMSVAGHSLADLEQLIGEPIGRAVARATGKPFVPPDPQKMYEIGKQDFGTSLAGLGVDAPVGGFGPGALARPPPFTPGSMRDWPLARPPEPPPLAAAPPPVTDVTAASDRLRTYGQPVDVPRALASDSPDVQQTGQLLSKVPVAGTPLRTAVAKTATDLGGAVKGVADELGSGAPVNVAGRIRNEIETAASGETEAATQAAQASDAEVRAAYDRANAQRLQDINAGEQQAVTASNDRFGSASPQELGETAIDSIRREHAAARDLKNQRYTDIANTDGTIDAAAAQSAHPQVVQKLEADGFTPDPELTPATNAMLRELKRFGNLDIGGQTPEATGAAGAVTPAGELPPQRGITLQGVEQVYKRLNNFARGASNAADRTMAGQIMEHFRDWQHDAIANSLLPGGDPNAANVSAAARAANTDYRQRFGYNARGSRTPEADRLVNKIVTQDAQPEDVARQLLQGNGKSATFIDRATAASGNSPDLQAALRGAQYRKLTQTPGGEALAPEKAAKNINDYLGGNADHAQRVFPSAQDQMTLHTHANALTEAQAARDQATSIAKATTPTPTKPVKGPAQQFRDIAIGAGKQSDEQLFNAIEGWAKSPNRADVGSLGRLMQSIPDAQRGDFSAALLRRMGQTATPDEFSVARFVSEWDKMTPQSKTLLFGNAGPQRQALEDIATIAKRHKEVGTKFGNPSGTGQAVGLLEIVKGMITKPLGTAATVLGGRALSSMLASPAGAASLARWLRTSAALRSASGPTAGGVAAFRIATRNLVNTAQGLGVPVPRVTDTLPSQR